MNCPIKRNSCLKPLHCYFLRETDGKCIRTQVVQGMRKMGASIQQRERQNAEDKL